MTTGRKHELRDEAEIPDLWQAYVSLALHCNDCIWLQINKSGYSLVRECRVRDCGPRRNTYSRSMAGVDLPSSPRYATNCNTRTSRDPVPAAGVFPTYFPLTYAYARHSTSPISYQDHIHEVTQMKDCCMRIILLNALQEHVLTRDPINTDLNIQMLLHLLTM